MRKSWLVCVLWGNLAWGQAPMGPMPPAPASAAQTPGSGNKPPAPAAAPVAENLPANAPVITITGFCPATPRATAAKTATGGKTAAVPAKKPADCKTVITRAEFEKIANGVSPTVTPQLKRQLANVLPRYMVMSEAAKAKGLDKTERFNETVKFAKMSILTQELQRSIQEEAAKVSPDAIEDYYKKNPEAYEQFSLDRLFIPRYKQPAAEGVSEKEEKLTEEQQKAKEEADKAKQEQGEQEMSKLAEGLRSRAAAGEDFLTLQKEAFAAAGMKMESPTVNLPKVRRTGLPPAHATVFALKAGEVSQVISDNGGHYVYKVVSKEEVPLDQVKEEIHNTLKSQGLRDLMDKYQNSYKAENNPAYFGPAEQPGPRQMPPPRMPRPQGAPPAMPPPGQAPPPAQNPPAQPPPAAKPN